MRRTSAKPNMTWMIASILTICHRGEQKSICKKKRHHLRYPERGCRRINQLSVPSTTASLVVTNPNFS
jgi:hypothetical protein